MMFPNQRRNVGALVAIGMMCLAIGTIFPYIVHPASSFGQNWVHGIRGLLYGISIGMNLRALILGRRQSPCRAS